MERSGGTQPQKLFTSPINAEDVGWRDGGSRIAGPFQRSCRLEGCRRHPLSRIFIVYRLARPPPLPHSIFFLVELADGQRAGESFFRVRSAESVVIDEMKPEERLSVKCGVATRMWTSHGPTATLVVFPEV